MTEGELRAISYLPDRIAQAVGLEAERRGAQLNEIRLRENRALSLVIGGENVVCRIRCTRDEVDYTVDKLCASSLYSHAEDIRNGVISAENGIRAGVCGKAVVSGGRIECVRDITSVSIRIPHRIAGAADFLLPLVTKYGSVLVYSKPAGGKTTVLRELIPLLSKKYRVSVIDTRYELSCGVDESGMTDVFLGYPRYDGMMVSVRTMSPEYIICDEISTEPEAEAVLYAASSGVRVVASAHAGSLVELYKNKAASMLLGERVFGCLCGLGEFDSPPSLTFPDGDGAQ